MQIQHLLRVGGVHVCVHERCALNVSTILGLGLAVEDEVAVELDIHGIGAVAYHRAIEAADGFLGNLEHLAEVDCRRAVGLAEHLDVKALSLRHVARGGEHIERSVFGVVEVYGNGCGRECRATTWPLPA